MARKLVLVATSGLIGAVAFLTLGIGLAGPNHGNVMSLWGAMASTCGPAASSKQQIILPFDAVDSLSISVPATVRYQPGDRASATISGDRSLLDHVRLENGRLQLDCDPGWPAPRLEVSVSGPAIAEWKLLGNVDLSLSKIDQPRLMLIIRGSGSVTASGAAESVGLEISGSGAARLKELNTQSAQVEVRGSGDAQISARANADVSISGSGNVELFGNPTMHRSEIRGSGRITRVP